MPLSKTGAELLFEVFSQRYERASVLVTSNLPFDEWTEVLGSERLTGALLERRQLSPQAQPPQTEPAAETLNPPPPNAPRGEKASVANRELIAAT